MFSKKEEPKPAEKPPPALFSGMAMKKSNKPEVQPSTGYVPPSTATLQPKIETYSYSPPEIDTSKLGNSTKNTESSFIDSSENNKSYEDPFADIKISDAKPKIENKPKVSDTKNYEESKETKKFVGQEEEIKSVKKSVPAFWDNDDDSESLGFVKKSKLNFPNNKEDSPIKTSLETEKKNYIEDVPVKIEKNIEIRRVSQENIEKNTLVKKFEEEKVEEPKKNDNKVLKAIEEKRKKEAEEKERKEKEERERIELIQQREKEEKLEKEREAQKKIEEEKILLEKFSNSENLRDLIVSNLSLFSDKILEKIQQQEKLKNSQQELLNDVMEKQKKITELETLEDEAASQEEFEEAARYHEELENLKELCKVNHELIQNNSSKYSTLESEKNDLLQQKQKWIQDTLETSNSALEKVHKTLENNKIAAEKLRKEKIEELTSKNHEASQQEEELLRILASVTEQKNELDKKIYEKSETFQNEEKQLAKELKELQEEIKTLEEILAKKKSDAAILSKNLFHTREILKKNMEEFEEENFEVEEAAKVVQNDLETILKLKEHYQRDEDQSLQIFTDFTEKYNKKIEELELFKEELYKLQKESLKIKSLQENREKYLLEIQEIEKILQEKEENLWDAQEYYSNSKESIDQFKENIRIYEEKIKEIDKKIPILENDKKTAASSKQFKEASRLNNEIKDLNNEYNLLQEKVQCFYKELIEKEDSLQKIEKSADEIRNEILRNQKLLEETKGKLLYAEETIVVSNNSS